MANPKHLAILENGVEAWNQWRSKNREVTPGLSGADLRRAHLVKANLRSANLHSADLSEAELTGADLRSANLSSTILRSADLRLANLWEANLNSANLINSNLCRANLNLAELRGANLTGGRVGSTTFTNVDLSDTTGLETLEHFGPSSVGIDTIYKSKGRISHIFLRGVGVPEGFITYIESLNFIGIEPYSLFISYSTKDQEFAERLHADLQARGVRCWFAPHDMRPGMKVHEQIEGAIQMHEKLLLILSPESMASDWVRWEISNARTREIKENRQILFPIRLCPYETLLDWKCPGTHPGSDLAPEVREYFIPDFGNWKNHVDYSAAFEKLIMGLHGEPDSLSA